jgi:RNA polymerase sigma-70 factor (ECF subfamily)
VMATAFASTGCSYSEAEISAPVESESIEDQIMDMFTEMRSPILRHLLWLNLRPDQAEDIVQETFLRLYQHLSRSDFPRHNIRGWIWRVSHNLGVNLRVAANRKERGAELALEDVSSWLADSRPDPEQTLQQVQREQLIAVGIRLLNARDKQCVHLRAQGLGYRQIASVLGIGRSTVADTMSRVTTFLRSNSRLS